MSDKKIEQWHEAIHPTRLRPAKWEIGSGGSWDMAKVQPIPDKMLAELTQHFAYNGTPWNCRSMPLSPGEREYMYLLYYSMQGLVARMRAAERAAAELSAERVYEDGQMARGISTRFLARLTLLRVATGLMPKDHPLAVEAEAMFAEQPLGVGTSEPRA